MGWQRGPRIATTRPPTLPSILQRLALELDERWIRTRNELLTAVMMSWVLRAMCWTPAPPL